MNGEVKGLPMKVLQVLPELNTGGVERGTLEMGRALVESGHQSYVVSSGGVLTEQLEIEGSRHFQIPVSRKHLRTLWSIKSMRKLIKEIAPDIVHVRSRVPAWIVFLALQTLPQSQQPKVVSTFHGMYSKPWYSRVMTYSDHIISVSDTVTDHIISTYAVHPEKITRIYRGCDTDVFCKKALDSCWLDDWYARHPQTRGKLLLTLPARVTKWKGVDAMIELISRLDNRFHALIVGPINAKKQRYWQALQALVFSKNIHDNITFCGARSDIDSVYRLSNLVYNLSSKPEPFGRTVCEAANVGTKVIAWGSGGPQESLSAIFPEGLVEPGNMQQLVEKTLALVDRDDLKPKSNVFTSQSMTRQTIHLYMDLLNVSADSATMNSTE